MPSAAKGAKIAAMVPEIDLGLDLGDPKIARGVAHMYSGGADSSLAACVLAEHFPKVFMNTYRRPGFMGMDAPQVHLNRIRKRFSDVEFIHSVMEAGPLYEEVERYHSDRRKSGYLVLNTCGHCKVALHWRNLLFCLTNGVSYASDGAVVGAEQFAEQNPRILMPELVKLYRDFGVTLLHPVYKPGIEVEQALYELGITERRRIKMTTQDHQVVCTQHIMFAASMRVYLEDHTFEEYERSAREYLAHKLDHIKELTAGYLRDPSSSPNLSRLLA